MADVVTLRYTNNLLRNQQFIALERNCLQTDPNNKQTENNALKTVSQVANHFGLISVAKRTDNSIGQLEGPKDKTIQLRINNC